MEMSPMYETILVPLDGSDGAEAAVPHAAAISEAFGSRVIVLEVGGGYLRTVGALIAEAFGAAGSVQSTIAVEEAQDQLALAYLEALRESKGKPDWIVELTDGDPSDIIVRRAAELHADMIVMASEGHSRITRSLLGSVSGDVVNRSRIPVLVVHASQD
jgi:nucleotide-binding universal stress UspA family protein